MRYNKEVKWIRDFFQPKNNLLWQLSTFLTGKLSIYSRPNDLEKSKIKTNFLQSQFFSRYLSKLLFNKIPTGFLDDATERYNTGVLSPGVPGVPWHPQILADQLTLSQPRGANYANQIILAPPGFSDLPTAL